MKIAQRLWPWHTTAQEDLDRFISFMKKYPGAADEIVIFADYLHTGIQPLDPFEERCKWMGQCMDQLKKAGFKSVGINLLSTVGHLGEASDFWYEPEFPMMVGADGTVTKGVNCPMNEKFQEYVAKKYAMIARQNPDFIWVDDDMRMHNHEVKFCCFCDACMEAFNKANHSNYTREELVERFNTPEGAKERALWIALNAEKLRRIMQIIEETVHGINPGIEIGLMTTTYAMTTYSGGDYRPLFAALKAGRGRPGGGFWDESVPMYVFYKAIEVSRQISAYPEGMKDLQFELESLPYHLLEKSPGMIITECTSAFFHGVNGVAMDLLRDEKGSMREYEPLLKRVEGIRPLWEKICEYSDCAPVGAYAVLSSNYMATQKVKPGKNWLEYPNDKGITGAYYTNESYDLLGTGLPMASVENDGGVIILERDLMCGYDRSQIEKWLSQGAFVDGEGLEYLYEIGLGEKCGVKIEKKYTNGVREIFTEDAANGEFAQDERDLRMQALNHGIAYALKPIDDGVRSITKLYGYDNSCLGDGFTVYENDLGGRVAVSGYFPWKHVHSEPKREQLLNVFDELAGGAMPVRVLGYHKIVPFVKRSADHKRYAIMLTNALMEESGEYRLFVQTENTTAKLYRQDSSFTQIEGMPVENGVIFTIDSTNTMDFRVLLIG